MKKQKQLSPKKISAAAAAKQLGAPDLIVEKLKQGKIHAPRASEAGLLTTRSEPWNARYETGKALRQHTPREAHAGWRPAADRPDPVALVKASNKGRIAELVPLRMQRMAASPFAFLRGAAMVMAWDLANAPSMGLNVVIDGDCHINNFGLFGSPQGDVVVDLNDFDEATVAPWEWDLKRLSASINLSGRDNGLAKSERNKGVMECVSGYRWSMARLHNLPVLDLWNRHTVADDFDDPENRLDKKSAAIVRKSVAKARENNNQSLLKTAAERQSDGRWRLKLDPPVTAAISDACKQNILAALHDYIKTLPPERKYMIQRYHVVDMVRRVAGVGSVGMRAYMILLIGNDYEDALFLQMKEAGKPAHAAYLPLLPEAYKHEGHRVVYGQRLLQAVGDPLLGWTTMEGRPYYVRQMKNLKGAIPTEWLSGAPFNFFAWGYGALLARAHARVGDAAVISGYCGKSTALDEAMADWAEAYASQTVLDHAKFVKDCGTI